MTRTVRYYERLIDGKIFHYVRARDNKLEAKEEAARLRGEGYLARVIFIKYLMSDGYNIYVYPRWRND